jgi:hypothetical protein
VSQIDVLVRAAADGWECDVEIRNGETSTRHMVRVTAAELALLAPAASEPDDLVRRSFTFLLEREPKESILRRFSLSDIGRYFPEYEATIRAT